MAPRRRGMDEHVLRIYLAQVAIENAQQNDYSEIARLLAILERPFGEQPDAEAYAALPSDWGAHVTVSGSSSPRRRLIPSRQDTAPSDDSDTWVRGPQKAAGKLRAGGLLG